MQRQRSSLVQLGIALLIIGVLIRVAISLTWALAPLTGFLIVGGIILLIIGLVTPGRR